MSEPLLTVFVTGSLGCSGMWAFFMAEVKDATATYSKASARTKAMVQQQQQQTNQRPTEKPGTKTALAVHVGCIAVK